ncbi:transposase [Streptomyces sp. NPDC056105]|uniref:transposase n=1 Tax=Streptomyces sp. NPDC056105 TaxID=3345714 RepID=UPI0035E23973
MDHAAPNTLTDSQRDQLNRILEACPDLPTARDLAHEFSTIARERRGQDLTHWMTRALDHGPPPVQSFVAFLQNDWDAVVNGLTLSWSSGAVEGQVTRIKLIKRRSTGRRRSLSCGRWSSLSRPEVRTAEPTRDRRPAR